jgi:hypothetical protein
MTSDDKGEKEKKKKGRRRREKQSRALTKPVLQKKKKCVCVRWWWWWGSDKLPSSARLLPCVSSTFSASFISLSFDPCCARAFHDTKDALRRTF